MSSGFFYFLFLFLDLVCGGETAGAQQNLVLFNATRDVSTFCEKNKFVFFLTLIKYT